MNEKYTAKQEKHAKRWRKENEIYRRMEALHTKVPIAILKEVESGLLEYKQIDGCDDFYFMFTLDRRCHLCYSVSQDYFWYLADSPDVQIDKLWGELCERILLGFKKGR
jgi:hypothetical protein